jgi:peroxiredoxin
LFAVPGAFTPTCSLKHLPGFIEKADELKAKGVDTIACVSVNDAFVMDAWGKSVGADGKVLMLADGSALFTKVRAGHFHLRCPRGGRTAGLSDRTAAEECRRGSVESLGPRAARSFACPLLSAGAHAPLRAAASNCRAQAIGTELDLTDRGLGVRSRRYALLVDDGVVKAANLEEGGAFTLSSAEDILAAL